MKKTSEPILYTLLVVLSVAVLLLTVVRSQKPDTEICTAVVFAGEYSQANGPWQPLDSRTPLSALKGDVVLRGHFRADIPDGEMVSVYLNHVDYCLLVDGHEIHRSDSHTSLQLPDACSAHWESFRSPAISAAANVELHLHNPHSCGDAGAYLDLLNNIYIGSPSLLPETLFPQSILLRSMALLVGGLSLAILGVAAAFAMMKLPAASQLWSLGLISLCMSGYLGLDNIDASLLLSSHVFTTYGELLCLIVALLELNRFLSHHLQHGRRAAVIAFTLHAAAVTILLAVCLLGLASLYDLLSVWSSMQLVLCPILMTCCVCEAVALRHCRLNTVAAFLLLCCTMIELFGTFFPRYPSGLPVKLVFLVLFFIMLVRCIKYIAVDRSQAIRAEELQNQLRNSSIALATGQIRTHFVFNVLNAISGLCKYDPAKADDAIVRFSRYLRSNIDIMQAETLVPFPASLQHVENYVSLEQIRFGDSLRFVTDIQVDDFLLPPLVLQPLVENAIKHGITSQSQGGTVTLQTLRQDGHILIRISDDGVGFDPTQAADEGSIALQNIHFRLQHMVNGTLHIESTPGQGTVCTVSIPEKEATPCM